MNRRLVGPLVQVFLLCWPAAAQSSKDLQNGQNLAVAGDCKRAIRPLRRAAATKGSEAELALHWLAFCLRQLERFPEALDIATQLVGSGATSSSRALNQLGLAHLAAGDLDAAAVAFERSLALNPSEAAAAFNLGDVLLRKGARERATSALTQFIQHQSPGAPWPPDQFSEAQIGTYDVVTDLRLATAPNEPVEARGSVVGPEKVYAPPPDYPAEALREHAQGAAVLQLQISAGGEVLAATPLKVMRYRMNEAARDAVLAWRFSPATYRGRPVAVVWNLVVNFRLQH